MSKEIKIMQKKIVLLSALILTTVPLISEQSIINNNTNSTVTVTIGYKPTIDKQTCVEKMFTVQPKSKVGIDILQRGCTPYSFFVKASDGILTGKWSKFVVNHPFTSAFTVNIIEGPNNTLSVEIK